MQPPCHAILHRPSRMKRWLHFLFLLLAASAFANVPEPRLFFLKQVGGSNTVFWAARGFNALGQLIGVNFGNGVVTTNDYFANSKRLRRVVTFKCCELFLTS
jgi:hypothetical protein